MAVVPPQFPPQPSPEWYKSINGGTISQMAGVAHAHSVIANATPFPPANGNSISTKEHLIQGEMITVQKMYSDLIYFEMESKWQMDLPDIIKEELMDKLVGELMKHNCISFTTQIDPASGDRYFRARIFATPNDQTVIIRELLSKNNTA